MESHEAISAGCSNNANQGCCHQTRAHRTIEVTRVGTRRHQRQAIQVRLVFTVFGLTGVPGKVQTHPHSGQIAQGDHPGQGEEKYATALAPQLAGQYETKSNRRECNQSLDEKGAHK